MPRKNSIPILLLTGFLGAGKTTLLNHLLANDQGLKIGVIVNDFGEINIDALLVSAQTDTMLQLSNGCICCSIEEGDNLDDALGQLAHRGSSLDYIIIEASGLAEPKELATILRLSKNEYCHFDALVNIVDGLNFEKNNQAAQHILDDLAISDLIILNKSDLVSKSKLEEIKKGLQLTAPKTPILVTTQGRVDFQFLLDLNHKPTNQPKLKKHDSEDHHHLHHQFKALSFKTEKPLDPEKFEAWAQALGLNIFRAKGIIYFGAKGLEQKFIFQAVGARFELKLDEWILDEEPQTRLVIIGLDLDETKIQKTLESLIDSEPNNISAQTLMDILKYK